MVMLFWRLPEREIVVRDKHPLTNDRRMDEPWHDRWYRLFGVDPGLRECKQRANNKEQRTYKTYKRNK